MWRHSLDSDSMPSATPLAKPRLAKWDGGSPVVTPGTKPPYDHMRSSIHDFLGNRRLSDFPDVPDGSNAWFATFDRLSKKITTQKHDLWDCQAKLRIEIEKNRDLVKIIQAERKKHREVEYVLTSKIESQELELEGLRRHLSTRNGHLDDLPASQFEASPLSMAGQPAAQKPKPHLFDEATRMTVSPSSRDAKESMDENLVADLRKEIERLTQENEALKPKPLNTEPAANTDHPRKEAEAPARDYAQENEALLASNKELHDKMRLQSVELALQIEHHNEVRKHLEMLASHYQNEGNHNTLQQTPRDARRSQQRHQASRSSNPPTPLTPTTSSPKLEGHNSDSDGHYSSPDTSTSIASSTLQPPLHSSSIQSDSTSINTVASSTSTPATKLTSAKLKKERALDDPNVERLDRLYHNLRHGKVSQDELARYEEIYRNSLQSFAERPQLRSDTQQLIDDLYRKAGPKHTRMISMVKDDAL